MARKVVNENELKELVSTICHTEEKEEVRKEKQAEEEKEQPNELSIKPKPTLKLHQQLINELQRQNLELAMRVDELEKQLYELCQVREQVAIASELPDVEDQGAAPIMATVPPAELSQYVQISRSQRHPALKKKPFWAIWFRTPSQAE